MSDVKYIDTDDGTMVYVKDSDGDVYKQAFADNEQLIKLNVGDRIEIKYEPSEDGINYMTSYEYIEKQAYRIIEKRRKRLLFLHCIADAGNDYK